MQLMPFVEAAFDLETLSTTAPSFQFRFVKIFKWNPIQDVKFNVTTSFNSLTINMRLTYLFLAMVRIIDR